MRDTFPYTLLGIFVISPDFFLYSSQSLPVIFVYRAAPCIVYRLHFAFISVMRSNGACPRTINRFPPSLSPFSLALSFSFLPSFLRSFASLYRRYQVGMRCRLRFVVSLAINFMSPMVISVDLQRIKTSARGRSPIARAATFPESSLARCDFHTIAFRVIDRHVNALARRRSDNNSVVPTHAAT